MASAESHLRALLSIACVSGLLLAPAGPAQGRDEKVAAADAETLFKETFGKPPGSPGAPLAVRSSLGAAFRAFLQSEQRQAWLIRSEIGWLIRVASDVAAGASPEQQKRLALFLRGFQSALDRDMAPGSAQGKTGPEGQRLSRPYAFAHLFGVRHDSSDAPHTVVNRLTRSYLVLSDPNTKSSQGQVHIFKSLVSLVGALDVGANREQHDQAASMVTVFKDLVAENRWRSLRKVFQTGRISRKTGDAEILDGLTFMALKKAYRTVARDLRPYSALRRTRARYRKGMH